MNAAYDTVRGVLRRGEQMARHTSWRVGGPADRYFEPADRDDLIRFVRSLPPDEPLTWVGLGSNLLVRDGGVRGTVISLHGCLDRIELGSDGRVCAEAGAHCARLAKFCAKAGFAGSAFFVGIPGTVGGALAMNAGAHGGETWRQVVAAEVLYRNGRVSWEPPETFAPAYRHVDLPSGFAGFLGACFAFAPDTEGRAGQQMKDWLETRRRTQPVGRPSCGSVFRNPDGDHAARLIEQAGLKGFRIGGAVVSDLHANFILNEGAASAADIERLIDHVRETVRARHGVDLWPEVRVIGEVLDG